MAAVVERDHPVVRREHGRDPVPHVRVVREAVQEQEQRSLAGSTRARAASGRACPGRRIERGLHRQRFYLSRCRRVPRRGRAGARARAVAQLGDRRVRLVAQRACGPRPRSPRPGSARRSRARPAARASQNVPGRQIAKVPATAIGRIGSFKSSAVANAPILNARYEPSRARLPSAKNRIETSGSRSDMPACRRFTSAPLCACGRRRCCRCGAAPGRRSGPSGAASSARSAITRSGSDAMIVGGSQLLSWFDTTT